MPLSFCLLPEPVMSVMRIGKLHMSILEIPLRTSFKHASAERSKTASILVHAELEDGSLSGYGEGCPREYVTGESTASAIAFLDRHRTSIIRVIDSVPALKSWVTENREMIDENPAAWCAIELALLDLLGKVQHQPLEELLSLPPITGSFRYSAVLGDGPMPAFEKQFAQYLHAGFDDFKIKLSGNRDVDKGKLSCLNGSGQAIRLRADANNLWQYADEAIEYLSVLEHSFWAIEEPLRARDLAGLASVGAQTGLKVILDESCVRSSDLDGISTSTDNWIPNLRVSKLGGLLRSLEILVHAQGHGVIVGAHVGETSILTRAGLALAWAAKDKRIAMEGGFGTLLLETDICDPPVMFRRGGMLSEKELYFSRAPGNGLRVTPPASHQ
jgi:L-alanine-DL-glutamate epimerase-like enolase superfamily enzyme